MKNKIVNIPLAKAYKLINPGPVVIISTFDGKSTYNAAPIAWITPLDFKPALFTAVISSEHKTYANLLTTKKCIINIPSSKNIMLIKTLATASGHKGDKLKNISVSPGKKVKVKKLDDAIAWIEAKLVKIISKDNDLVMLEGVCAYALEGAVTKNHELNVLKYKTLHHLGGTSFFEPGKVRKG